MDLLGTSAAAFTLSLIVLIGLGVLDTVAVHKIITKAGYSGAWILAPLSVVFLSIVTAGVAVHAARSFSSASWGTAGALVKLDWADVLFNWVLFLIFAFAQWPALRSQPRWSAESGWRASAPTSVPMHTLPPPPPGAFRASTPPSPAYASLGWYPIAGRTDEQVYWNGHAYTARRQWRDDSWKDVALNFFSANPPRPEDRVEE